MTRERGRAQLKKNPTTITKDGVTRPITKAEMAKSAARAECHFRNTMAEQAAETGTRDHLICEMYQWAQFEDGSVLNSLLTDINPTATFTAQEVVDGLFVIYSDNPHCEKLGKIIMGDMLRNAKAAIKNGTTKNLAPRV
jgi:hypothetical protein